MIGYDNCLEGIKFNDNYYAFLDYADNLFIYQITLNRDKYISFLKQYGITKPIEFECYISPKKIESYLNEHYASYLKEKRIVSVEYQKRELFKRFYQLSSFSLDNLKNFFEKRKINWENLVNNFYDTKNLELLEVKLFFYSLVEHDNIYTKAIKDLMLTYEYEEVVAMPVKELKTYANCLDWYYKIGFSTDMNEENFDYYLENFLNEAYERNFDYDFLDVGIDFKQKLISIRSLK